MYLVVGVWALQQTNQNQPVDIITCKLLLINITTTFMVSFYSQQSKIGLAYTFGEKSRRQTHGRDGVLSFILYIFSFLLSFSHNFLAIIMIIKD